MSKNHLKNHCPKSSLVSKLNWNENGTMTMWIGENVYLIEDVSRQLAEEWIGRTDGVGSFFNKKVKPHHKIHRVS
jgi:hypothetical protein